MNKITLALVTLFVAFASIASHCDKPDDASCCDHRRDYLATTEDGKAICQRPNKHKVYVRSCNFNGDPLDAGADVGGDADGGSEPDTGEPDVGEPDTGEPDVGEPDVGEPDVGEPDVGEPDGGYTPVPEPDYSYLDRSDMRFLYTWAGGNYRGDDIVLNQSFRQDYINFITAPHGYTDQAFNRVALQPIMYSYGPVAQHFANCQAGEDRFVYLAQPVFDPLRGSSAVSVNYSGNCDGTLTMPAVTPDDMRDALRDLHAAGVSVDFLDGQAIWLATDANSQRPVDILKDVLDFNRASASDAERFDGIHFDIEPHIVGSGPYGGVWWQGTTKLTYGNKYNPDWERRWIQILRDCRDLIDAYVEETGHAFSLSEFQGSDTPYYREYHMKQIDAADDNVHFLVIGNYFDGRANINGNNSFIYGDQEYSGQPVTGGLYQYFDYMFNTPVVFAAETGGNAPDRFSFGDAGGAATANGPYDGYVGMYEIFDLAEQHLQLGTLGLGVHHGGYPYDYGIRTMQPSY